VSRTIAIVCHGPYHAQIDSIVAACQVQLTRDVEPAWHLAPTELGVVDYGAAPPRNAWQLVVTPHYYLAHYYLVSMTDHETPEGQPRAVVWTGGVEAQGHELSAYVSAALIGMVVDPRIRLFDHSAGIVIAREPVTPAWGYTYPIEASNTIGEVHVSDFVYPAWYDDPNPWLNGEVSVDTEHRFSQGPFDRAGRLPIPGALAVDLGSMLAWEGGNWFQTVVKVHPDFGLVQTRQPITIVDYFEPTGLPKRVWPRIEQCHGRPPE
jgi:hypothetical protein